MKTKEISQAGLLDDDYIRTSQEAAIQFKMTQLIQVNNLVELIITKS